MDEDETALRERLTRIRTVPEFTMQAVTTETGVPGDTIRSWQRRYDFPRSSRNDSNYRLFSRQDIEAVMWVRDQTERGQGTREAITMLNRIMKDTPTSAPKATLLSPVMPAQTLSNALLDGDLEAAQVAWDRLALSVSPESLCSDVIVPAHRRLREVDPALAIRMATDAFLTRKTLILLDQSGPERGHRDAVVLTESDRTATVPALALATILSRSGFRLRLPLLDIRDAETIIVMQQMAASAPAILVRPGHAGAARHLLPDRDVLQWWYDTPESPTDATLPSSLHDAVATLSAPA